MYSFCITILRMWTCNYLQYLYSYTWRLFFPLKVVSLQFGCLVLQIAHTYLTVPLRIIGNTFSTLYIPSNICAAEWTRTRRPSNKDRNYRMIFTYERRAQYKAQRNVTTIVGSISNHNPPHIPARGHVLVLMVQQPIAKSQKWLCRQNYNISHTITRWNSLKFVHMMRKAAESKNNFEISLHFLNNKTDPYWAWKKAWSAKNIAK